MMTTKAHGQIIYAWLDEGGSRWASREDYPFFVSRYAVPRAKMHAEKKGHDVVIVANPHLSMTSCHKVGWAILDWLVENMGEETELVCG